MGFNSISISFFLGHAVDDEMINATQLVLILSISLCFVIFVLVVSVLYLK